jgi:hypothetical protein
MHHNELTERCGGIRVGGLLKQKKCGWQADAVLRENNRKRKGERMTDDAFDILYDTRQHTTKIALEDY